MPADLYEVARILNQTAALLKADNDGALPGRTIADLTRWSRLNSAALALILEAWTEKLRDLRAPEFWEVAEEATALHDFLLDQIEHEERRQYEQDQALHDREAKMKARL